MSRNKIAGTAAQTPAQIDNQPVFRHEKQAPELPGNYTTGQDKPL